MSVCNKISMSVQDDNGGVNDDDTNNQGDEGAGDGNQGDSEKNSQHNGADTGDGEGKNNSQDQKDSHRNNPAGDEGDGKNDDDVEPPTRKSKLQYIKERQERARQKRAQLDNQKQNKNSQSSNSDDENDDESFSEEEEKGYSKFERRFFKEHGDKLGKVDKVIEATEQNEVNNEITEFFKNDEYSDLVKEHEKTLRKYALHPSRREVPLEEIMYGIAGRKLIAYGAEQARKAMKLAQKSRNGGTSNRKVEGSQEKSVIEMSDAEFLEEQQKVLRGRR